MGAVVSLKAARAWPLLGWGMGLGVTVSFPRCHHLVGETRLAAQTLNTAGVPGENA